MRKYCILLVIPESSRGDRYLVILCACFVTLSFLTLGDLGIGLGTAHSETHLCLPVQEENKS